jgi:hypothetical protein
MNEAKIETGTPNYYILLQVHENKINIVLKRDMISFSLVTDADTFMDAIQALYGVEYA